MALDINRKLGLMRMKSAPARILFDFLRTYTNFITEMEVQLLSKKTGLSQKEVRDVLLMLERLNLGRLWLGRRNKQTRFAWSEDFRECIPGQQPGEPELLDPLEALNVKGVGGATATPLNEWVIALGGRRQAKVLLPAIVEAVDLLKVRAFCDQYVKSLKEAT